MESKYRRPTNCGVIVNGSMGEPIEGPLEWYYKPYEMPRWHAVMHMQDIYTWIGGTGSTRPSIPYMWPAPQCDDGCVRVELETPTYLLIVEFEYRQGYGYYKCYGVVDRTHTIIAVHHIYGTNTLLSIVQMVKEYCHKEAEKYVQCRTCWYCSRDLKYCGQGLEMNTGTCNHHKGRPLIPPLRWTSSMDQ